MTRLQKILILELWFFLWLPFLAGIMVFTLKVTGLVLFMLLFFFWCWQLYAYSHYRFCRQEEFLFVIQTAADANAPLETVLKSYLRDRPRDDVYRFWVSTFLTFVFPGYYWIHKQRSYDVRLKRLASMMQSGASLNQALRLTPGVVSREIALAVTIGQFTGKPALALSRLPDRKLALQWLELVPRLVYPFLVFGFMMIVLNFVVIFIVPKFEKIFLDFKMKLPAETEMMIFGSRWLGKYWYIPVFAGVLLIVAANLLVLSSRFRWYFPFVGGFYRQHARGHFLHVLGLMMETGRPLPQILGCLVESRFLPTAIADRVHSLMYQVQQGEPFADSLVRCGLAAKHQYALIVSAQKAQNLPWALQSLGDSLIRRSAQMSHRISMIVFPILVLACAGLVAFVAIALFSPMIELLEGLHGKI